MNETNNVILKVKNISKTFGSFQALENVSFEVKKGERIGLIGANGAGKTTISEIIIGLNKPTDGEIEYGFDYIKSPQEKLGMQFQSSSYPSGLTVKDMLKFAINIRSLYLSSEEIKKWLEIFQMEDFYHRKAKSLSGGQRQKLNILMSIIHHPELIILDELSTGLDIAAREDIIKFTDMLLTRENMATILISHHLEEIKTLCDKVVVLGNGKVIQIAKIVDIEKEHGSLGAYTKSLIKEQLSKDKIAKDALSQQHAESMHESKVTKMNDKIIREQSRLDKKKKRYMEHLLKNVEKKKEKEILSKEKRDLKKNNTSSGTKLDSKSIDNNVSNSEERNREGE